MNSNKPTQDESIVQLPEDGIINTAWAQSQLERASLFSSFELNANKGRIFFMLKNHLSGPGYEQSVTDLDYTVETAEIYIRFLEKLPVLEAIKSKYFTALSLSASELIPDTVDEAMALMDICLARMGKPTAKNLAKAIELTGAKPKTLTNAALTIDALKKKSLHEWLLNEYQLSDDDVLQASSIKTEGKAEFLEKMLQAYSLLEDWKDFYDIIAKPVKESNNPKALRFLSDIQDASESITEYLASEKAYHNLSTLKETFENEVYPKISMEAHNES